MFLQWLEIIARYSLSTTPNHKVNVFDKTPLAKVASIQRPLLCKVLSENQFQYQFDVFFHTYFLNIEGWV